MWQAVAVVILAGCRPGDTGPAVAGRASTDDEVHCTCVINQHDKGCPGDVRCPGPDCPCETVDVDLCLPPDLNPYTGDAATRARLLAMSNADFDAAIADYCGTRAQAILTDMGAVSEHDTMCDGAPVAVLGTVVDAPVLIDCEPTAWDARTATSTTYGDTCASPCPDVLCVNGPKSEHPDENCDAEQVFEADGTIRPEGCACNQVAAASTCDGEESEVFCSP